MVNPGVSRLCGPEPADSSFVQDIPVELAEELTEGENVWVFYLEGGGWVAISSGFSNYGEDRPTFWMGGACPISRDGVDPA